MEETKVISLNEELKSQEKIMNESLPEELKNANDAMVNDLIDKKIRQSALKIGDTVENFELLDAFGKKVSLKSLLVNGPVVLNFYRGSWCPFCNLQLASLQKNIQDFEKLNATLVAISAEKPDKSILSVEKHNLKFPVLSDYKNEVAKKYGIIFIVPEYLVHTFKKFGLDLENHYENEEVLLPIPSTFVIGKDHKVKYAFSSENFTRRAEPSDILDVLKHIND